MKKIGFVLVYVIGLSALIASINGYCPDSKVCQCTPEYIRCICSYREEITFQDEEETFTGEEITIRRCGKVKIMKLSLKNLHAESVDISDILELYIESYAFDDSSVRRLHIFDIIEFHLETYGLGNIKNISSLIISNVTLENIVASVLGDIEARDVVIKNSHIGTIKSRALHMQNVQSFSMENNVINVLDITCIAIKNIKNFNFTRNVVTNSNFGAISLSIADSIDFGYCTFRYIHSSIVIVSGTNLFSFHDNYVEYCGDRAFWSIQAINQIRFVNNQFLKANDDSLLPNIGPNSNNLNIVVHANNTFVCDCDLEWLLITKHPTFDFIKERSYCYEPPYLADLKLSQLELLLDKVGTCISVGPLTTTTASTPASTTGRKVTSLTSKLSSTFKIQNRTSGSTPAKPITVAPTQSEVKERYTASCGDPYICKSLLFSSIYIFVIWWLQLILHFV